VRRPEKEQSEKKKMKKNDEYRMTRYSGKILYPNLIKRITKIDQQGHIGYQTRIVMIIGQK
jgi:hypothetical protein